jgi:hypothetical protein
MASISDSECIKAAQDVEQLDRDLDDLMRELAENSSTSNGSTNAKTVKPNRKVDFDSLVAWLDGTNEALLPDIENFSNLLTKPIEQCWLDERAMTVANFQAACNNPTIISISSTEPPITISSSSSVSSLAQSAQADSQILASVSQPAQLPTVHATCAPKANRKSRSTKANGQQYAKWSMSDLQEEYLRRFQPISQKHTLDRQFMIDALTYNDMDQTSKYSKSSAKMQRTSMPAKKQPCCAFTGYC